MPAFRVRPSALLGRSGLRFGRRSLKLRSACVLAGRALGTGRRELSRRAQSAGTEDGEQRRRALARNPLRGRPVTPSVRGTRRAGRSRYAPAGGCGDGHPPGAASRHAAAPLSRSVVAAGRQGACGTATALCQAPHSRSGTRSRARYAPARLRPSHAVLSWKLHRRSLRSLGASSTKGARLVRPDLVPERSGMAAAQPGPVERRARAERVDGRGTGSANLARRDRGTASRTGLGPAWWPTCAHFWSSSTMSI